MRQSLTNVLQRKQRERVCARCAAQTASERQVTLQQKGTHECERMAAETPEERETILQQMSTYTSTEGWYLKPPRREKQGYSG